jgi:hypothetical protein
LRRLIGDHRIIVNRKGLAPALMQAHPRLIFTANNPSLLHSFVQDREMQPEDREALAIRLLHIEVQPEAVEWLRMRGGRKFTAGWISDGLASGYVLAKHLLWLYERRESFGRGQRLLVEGNIDDYVMDEMRLNSEGVIEVIEALVRMIESWGHVQDNPKYDFHVDLSERKVHVTAATIRAFIRDRIKPIHDISVRRISSALKSIVLGGGSELSRVAGIRRRRYAVDLPFLISAAERYGWPTEGIHAILEGKAYEQAKEQSTNPLPFSVPGGA